MAMRLRRLQCAQEARPAEQERLCAAAAEPDTSRGALLPLPGALLHMDRRRQSVCCGFLRRLKISKGTKQRMTETVSNESNMASREMESPGINRESNGYKDHSYTLSQDSGYNESLSTLSFDHSGSHYEAQSINTISLLHEHSDNVDPSSQLTVLSPITSEKFSYSILDRKGENVHSTGLYETPKATPKDVCLRRRLLMSKAASHGSFEYFDTPEELNCVNRKKQPFHHVPSVGQSLLNSFDDSPLEIGYKPIATSTLKTEETVAPCQKRRLAFTQQRTSTIDDSKPDGNLLTGVEFTSPVQHSVDSGNSDRSLPRINDLNPSDSLLKTPNHCKTVTIDEEFLTPISNLAAHFNFRLAHFSTSPVEQVNDLDDSTTREDSAFLSLSLDKSQDSLTDHDGSFQELLQKRKETTTVLHTKSRQTHLERSKRLSTLCERGSQSEAEDEITETELISLQYKLRAVRDSVEEECELSHTEEEKVDSLLKIEDLLGTPALRIVHEMLLRSKRKRPEQNTVQDLLGPAEGAEMSKSENILATLIGRKMGLEKVDILKELKCRNLRHVLAMVLGGLNVESICSVWKVSRDWREIIIQDKHAHQRRKLYLKKLKAEIEQGRLLSVEDAATRLRLVNRSVLKSVQAQAKSVFQTPSSCKGTLTPNNCSPAPCSASKQEEYVKVAKTLFTDEALKPCPRCQYPAKYQPVKKRGICSRQDCAFDFCILCLCSFHGSKECSSASTKRRSCKDALPGSAQSKRNLRRL